MAIVDKLMKIAGKDDFQLDGRISTVYILRLCWRYGWMMVRGRFFSFCCSNIANDVFIGHGVKTYEKKYLTMGSKTKLHDGVYIDALSARLGGVFLGDHVVLGRNTRIEVGDGCVVAANAVVAKKFPGNVVIGGIPAKIIKKRGL